MLSPANRDADLFGDSSTCREAESDLPTSPPNRISKRHFVKLLVASIAGTGASHVLGRTLPAEAEYQVGPPDTVTTDLTVRGDVTVCDDSGLGNVTVGNAAQSGRLNVDGTIE
jgi:hypothetical protein